MSRMLDALRRIEAKTATLAEQPEAETGASDAQGAERPQAERSAEGALDQLERSVADLQTEQTEGADASAAHEAAETPVAETTAESPAAGAVSKDTLSSRGVFAGASGIEACEHLAENILSRLPMGRSGAAFLADAGHSEARTELLAELLPVLARRAESEVLAVDADLQRGQLTPRLGVMAVRGVAHVLLRACAWQEAVRQTCLAGVRVLPSVEFADPEGRLLRPYRWERLFAELRRRFRLIVVDGASVVGAHPSPAARYCDAAYLLVCLGRTSYRQAAEAAAALRRQGARVEGCIAVGEDGARRAR